MLSFKTAAVTWVLEVPLNGRRHRLWSPSILPSYDHVLQNTIAFQVPSVLLPFPHDTKQHI